MQQEQAYACEHSGTGISTQQSPDSDPKKEMIVASEKFVPFFQATSFDPDKMTHLQIPESLVDAFYHIESFLFSMCPEKYYCYLASSGRCYPASGMCYPAPRVCFFCGGRDKHCRDGHEKHPHRGYMCEAGEVFFRSLCEKKDFDAACDVLDEYREIERQKERLKMEGSERARQQEKCLIKEIERLHQLQQRPPPSYDASRLKGLDHEIWILRKLQQRGDPYVFDSDRTLPLEYAIQRSQKQYP